MGEALRRRVLVVLCLTQITSWGVLYYAFPVMAPTIAADTGWSVPTATAAFSGGLVVSALVGIPVGRWLDRIGPRAVMTVGSAIAVPAVVGIATARTFVVFLVAWLLAGVAMAGTLYPPAFAALTRWWGTRRVVALTGLTLAAGLTSTIFGPLTAALLGALGWRTTYLVLALVLGRRDGAGAPLGPARSLARARPARASRARRSGPGRAQQAVRAADRRAHRRRVRRLRGAGGAGAAGDRARDVDDRGGVDARARRRRAGARSDELRRAGPGGGRPARTVGVLALCAATTALLGLLPGPAAALVAAAMLAGAARGIFTLLQATAVTDRWGTAYYGRLSGVLSAPSTLATALAPWAGAALAVPLGGYPGVFVLLAAVALVAAAAAVGSVPRGQRKAAADCSLSSDPRK